MIHIRFIEGHSIIETLESGVGLSSLLQVAQLKAQNVSTASKKNLSVPSETVKRKSENLQPPQASVPLSKMLKMRKFIPSNKELCTVVLEEFCIEKQEWGHPFQGKFSVDKEKFASGAFRHI